MPASLQGTSPIKCWLKRGTIMPLLDLSAYGSYLQSTKVITDQVAKIQFDIHVFASEGEGATGEIYLDDMLTLDSGCLFLKLTWNQEFQVDVIHNSFASVKYDPSLRFEAQSFVKAVHLHSA